MRTILCHHIERGLKCQFSIATIGNKDAGNFERVTIVVFSPNLYRKNRLAFIIITLVLVIMPDMIQVDMNNYVASRGGTYYVVRGADYQR
jgi:hypothetical protein